MDVVALLREEWSTVGMILAGVLGAYAAVRNGDWVWGATCAALVVACLEILQLKGWILQDGVTDR